MVSSRPMPPIRGVDTTVSKAMLDMVRKPSQSNTTQPELTRKSKSFGRTVNRVAFHKGKRQGNIKLLYTWDFNSELGSGSFGTVFKAKSLHDQRRAVAVKRVNKTVCADLDELWKEVGVLEQIDHPHVLRFYEAYEDLKYVYIVTELCQGGDLLHCLDRVRGDLAFASRITSETLSALAFCHSKGFCHRDLKLENILLLKASLDSPIRIADFGVASHIQDMMCKEAGKRARSYAKNVKRRSTQTTEESEKLPPLLGRNSASETARSSRSSQDSERVGSHDNQRKTFVRLMSFKGTPEYMAPEVLNVLNAKVNVTHKKVFYDFRCDVWSLGVVVHALLTGSEPYSLEELALFVEEDVPLKGISCSDPEALKFLQKCLQADFAVRPTSAELLRDDAWVQRFHKAECQNAVAIDWDKVRAKVAHFANLSHFKRAALTAAARCLNSYEQEELRHIFQSIDIDKSGSISLAELRAALLPDGTEAAEQDWTIRAFAAMDSDLTGEVEYTEFLAAVMDSRIEDRKDLARIAFRAFDLDGSATISAAELMHVLEDAELQRLLEHVQAIPDRHTREQGFGALKSLENGRRASLWSVDTCGAPFHLTPSFGKLIDLRFEAADIDKIMEMADTNADDEISFEQFLQLLKSDEVNSEL